MAALSMGTIAETEHALLTPLTNAEAIYKANCQSCHGATGTPNAGIAKMMGVKTAADYTTTEKEQIESVTKGKGKMKPLSPRLTDDQIKSAVAYFRTLK